MFVGNLWIFFVLIVTQIAFKCLSHFRHLCYKVISKQYITYFHGQNPYDDDLNSPVIILFHRNHLWF